MKVHLKLVFVMYGYLCLLCATGDQQISYQPYDDSSTGDIRINTLSDTNSNISPHHMTRQQIIHTGAMQSHPAPTGEKQTRNSGYTFNDFLYAMNGLSEEQQNSRTYRTSVNQPKYSSPHSYARQNYDSWPSTQFQESASTYTPQTVDPESTDKTLPKFNLIEPVTTKMSSKVSGLMELVLALLGSGSNNLIMKGFKDVIIEGIVRPLLVAKGGVKMLISKLTIPFISILLINLEVLVTVWWLWEDCSAPVQPAQPSYPSSSNSYNYKTFNTTFR